ncbi:MAG: hypothetical protein U9R56_01950 [candidate division Zixibacteria bacterium]|nr:hypothetical protein [candidate division Zixibacteria bacterium]
MQIRIGCMITDKNNNILGTVTRVINDSWTGDLKTIFFQGEDSIIQIKVAASDIVEESSDVIKLKRSAEAYKSNNLFNMES